LTCDFLIRINAQAGGVDNFCTSNQSKNIYADFIIDPTNFREQQHSGSEFSPVDSGKDRNRLQGKKVLARRLTVTSELPISLKKAWEYVQRPALLEYVAKGRISFRPVGGPFPEQWVQGKVYATKMRFFGFLPFGGTHYLDIELIDDQTHTIQTREWDRAARVWNHRIHMESLSNDRIRYTDEIVIYGKGKTAFITWFAKGFYKHRQKRWRKVPENL
jgi:hypothetical protein